MTGFGATLGFHHHDAGPWLKEIDAPTLVVGGEHDWLTPLSLSTEMAETIPDAELLILPKGSHAALIEHPELLNLRIEKFIHEKVEPFLASPGTKPRRAAGAVKKPTAKRAVTSTKTVAGRARKTAPATRKR